MPSVRPARDGDRHDEREYERNRAFHSCSPFSQFLMSNDFLPPPVWSPVRLLGLPGGEDFVAEW